MQIVFKSDVTKHVTVLYYLYTYRPLAANRA